MTILYNYTLEYILQEFVPQRFSGIGVPVTASCRVDMPSSFEQVSANPNLRRTD